MAGDLFETVVDQTGMAEVGIRDELTRLLEMHDKTPENMTLDDLREIAAAYLQEVLLQAKESA